MFSLHMSTHVPVRVPTHGHMTSYISTVLFMQDEYGDTALMGACKQGHVTIAALLIEKGATVDYQNKVRLSIMCIITMVTLIEWQL